MPMAITNSKQLLNPSRKFSNSLNYNFNLTCHQRNETALRGWEEWCTEGDGIDLS